MPTDHLESDVQRIVSGLSLDERIRLLSGADKWHVEGIPSAGLPPVMVADGPHGLRKEAGEHHGATMTGAVPATCFPTAVTLAATWDTELLAEVGRALGREARAEQVAVLLGPGVNLKRHPAGGRNFEYLSEDPLLAGRLAAALITGIQEEGVGASAKHLAANHQETFRMVVDTVVDERTLRELELAAFEIAVRDARPWTVMTAYNRLNGTYCSDHAWLLQDLLRDSWGFDGLVMSDWGGMNDRAAATRAGCDLEMPGSNGAFDSELRDAVLSGELDEGTLDRSVARVVELSIRAAAHRDDGATFDRSVHHALARRAAAAGTVLLSNDGTLPLDPDALGPVATVALIGAFANTPRYQGAGSSQVEPTQLDDLRSSLTTHIGDQAHLEYVPGYDPVSGATTDQLVTDAIRAAEGAEVAIVVAGLPGRYESEGFDRAHLDLPDGHTRVIEAVLGTGTPTVVVLQNGAPVLLPWSDRAAAVVEAYLGGQAGGAALGDVLTGSADPGGRLAESFPVAASDLPADAHFADHPKQIEYREGLLVGYRFHDTAGVPAAFPFGHGLSYTSFVFEDLELQQDGTDITAKVTVSNTGDRAGSEVVQLYVRPVAASVWRPAKELKAFAKVALEPGGSEQVTLTLDRRSFAAYDVGQGAWLVEAGDYELLLAASSTDVRLAATVGIASDDRPTPWTAPAGRAADDAEFAAWLGRPVPTPTPVRPFHRNTPVADLDETSLGQRIRQLLTAVARREVARTVPEEDAATRRMFESVIAEAPLRSLPLLNANRPPLKVIDTVIGVLNGQVRGRITELFDLLGARRGQ